MVPESMIRFQKCLDLRKIVEKYGSDAQYCRAFYYSRRLAECVEHEDHNKVGCKFSGWPGCQYHRYHYQASLTAEITFHNTCYNTARDVMYKLIQVVMGNQNGKKHV